MTIHWAEYWLAPCRKATGQPNVAAIGVNDMIRCRMYDVEHVESLGNDVVLVAVPMGNTEPFTSSIGTAFPAAPALGALLVAMDRESSTHLRQDL